MHSLPGVEGFMYPNEMELQWSILIVLYPFITGLVAGAFILASLERVFRVEAVKPTYRLALLTALAFMLVAPLPLQLHLGHPERSLQMFTTPHTTSAMAMFGFVYLWYLLAVLVIEIWLEYRPLIVRRASSEKGLLRLFYRILTLGSTNLSPRSLEIDDRVGRFITVLGIPSAFLLHGYVGFIFGSIKANPWWSTPLMPIVFLFSAIVSGIAAVLLIYIIYCKSKKIPIDVPCLDTIAKYLYYAFIVDFSLEMLDLIHRIYESDESFQSLDFMVKTKLYCVAHPPADRAGHPGAARPAGAHPDEAVLDRRAPADVRRGGGAHHGRYLRDALERGHRRSAVLEELPRLHHLQDGLRHPRGTPPGAHRDGAADLHPVGARQALPADGRGSPEAKAAPHL